jgi:hypothetical protein
MGQTYPAVLPAATKVQDGTALFNPTPTNATAATTSTPYEPDTIADRVKQHPGGGGAGWVNVPTTPADPDFVFATLMPRACNMPYQ